MQQIAQILAPKKSPVNQPGKVPANLPPVEDLPANTSTTKKTTLPDSTPNKQITNPK
ncbi:MAG: hypothetical protein HEQ26_21915 [Dolichospermum sp. DL01]|nr:MAG: hypothetical protein HEQ26_21915 [Dolichospermum sp. DL01]